jgi:hypothetical protein
MRKYAGLTAEGLGGADCNRGLNAFNRLLSPFIPIYSRRFVVSPFRGDWSRVPTPDRGNAKQLYI